MRNCTFPSAVHLELNIRNLCRSQLWPRKKNDTTYLHTSFCKGLITIVYLKKHQLFTASLLFIS